MKVAIFDHQGKSTALARALAGAGHEVVAPSVRADVFLIDLDVDLPSRRPWVDAHAQAGATVLLYPHGATPIVMFDGVHTPSPAVSANLVLASGHAEVMRRYGYPIPTRVIGWPYCELAPFRPAATIERLLFAPIHPFGNGYIAPEHADLNREAYERLLELGLAVTVRHVGTLEQNGLWPVPGVRYVQGAMDNGVADVEDADVVLSTFGTFSFLAVARGAPTVTFGQDVRPTGNDGTPGQAPLPVASWERYRDYMRYPLDLTDGPLAETLARAARAEDPVVAWRELFIGDPFDPESFVALVERLAGVERGVRLEAAS